MSGPCLPLPSRSRPRWHRAAEPEQGRLGGHRCTRPPKGEALRPPPAHRKKRRRTDRRDAGFTGRSPGQAISTVAVVAWTTEVGAGAGSLQVLTGSPIRAAGLPSISAVALPCVIAPCFVGGTWTGPPAGMCGGLFMAIEPTTAAGDPAISTSGLQPLVMVPLNGHGVGVGIGPPGLGIITMWMSCPRPCRPSSRPGDPSQAPGLADPGGAPSAPPRPSAVLPPPHRPGTPPRARRLRPPPTASPPPP